MTLINMKQRYVASTLCPIGKTAQPDCSALADRIFDDDASASAALIEHLVSAECHTREQLALVVGAVPANTHSFRLVYENRVANGYAA